MAADAIAEGQPATTAGAADDVTIVVPPPTEAASPHAWSDEEPATVVLPRPWRSVWVMAGIGLLCGVVVAFAIFGVVALVSDGNGGKRETNATTPVLPNVAPSSLPTASPAGVAQPPPTVIVQPPPTVTVTPPPTTVTAQAAPPPAAAVPMSSPSAQAAMKAWWAAAPRAHSPPTCAKSSMPQECPTTSPRSRRLLATVTR